MAEDEGSQRHSNCASACPRYASAPERRPWIILPATQFAGLVEGPWTITVFPAEPDLAHIGKGSGGPRTTDNYYMYSPVVASSSDRMDILLSDGQLLELANVATTTLQGGFVVCRNSFGEMVAKFDRADIAGYGRPMHTRSTEIHCWLN